MTYSIPTAMEPIRLICEFPVTGAFAEPYAAARGHYIYTTLPFPLETMVHGLRRVVIADGGLSDSKVRALAYAPQGYRSGIPKADWVVRGEYAWVDCRCQENRKSLAAFLVSGDMEWMAAEFAGSREA